MVVDYSRRYNIEVVKSVDVSLMDEKLFGQRREMNNPSP